jgi:hypothetical protein
MYCRLKPYSNAWRKNNQGGKERKHHHSTCEHKVEYGVCEEGFLETDLFMKKSSKLQKCLESCLADFFSQIENRAFYTEVLADFFI